MTKIIFIPFIFVSILTTPLYSQTAPGNVEKANQLGEEFQSQMPWSKEKTKGKPYYLIPQPEEYLSTPERETPGPEYEPEAARYPYCYNPYTRRYEYCYLKDFYYYRLRLRLPKFEFFFEHR